MAVLPPVLRPPLPPLPFELPLLVSGEADEEVAAVALEIAALPEKVRVPGVPAVPDLVMITTTGSVLVLPAVGVCVIIEVMTFVVGGTYDARTVEVKTDVELGWTVTVEPPLWAVEVVSAWTVEEVITVCWEEVWAEVVAALELETSVTAAEAVLVVLLILRTTETTT